MQRINIYRHNFQIKELFIKFRKIILNKYNKFYKTVVETLIYFNINLDNTLQKIVFM